MLATHVAADAGRGQSAGVEVNRARHDERVGLAAAGSVDWRRERELVEVQLELANGPLVVQWTSLQSEDANRRVEPLLVHRRVRGRHEVSFVGRDYRATGALIDAARAEDSAGAGHVAARRQTSLFRHAHTCAVVRGCSAGLLDGEWRDPRAGEQRAEYFSCNWELVVYGLCIYLPQRF